MEALKKNKMKFNFESKQIFRALQQNLQQLMLRWTKFSHNLFIWKKSFIILEITNTKKISINSHHTKQEHFAQSFSNIQTILFFVSKFIQCRNHNHSSTSPNSGKQTPKILEATTLIHLRQQKQQLQFSQQHQQLKQINHNNHCS